MIDRRAPCIGVALAAGAVIGCAGCVAVPPEQLTRMPPAAPRAQPKPAATRQQPTAAAESECRLAGVARFAPDPATDAGLPPEAPFAAGDLGSGRLRFEIAWDRRAGDDDADERSGRYGAAVRRFAVTIGERRLALPPEQASVTVSDGGFGQPQRESLRIDARAEHRGLALRAGWVQAFDARAGEDLGGRAGTLDSDRMPAAPAFADLPAPGATERAFYLLLAPEQSPARPLLALSVTDVEAVASCGSVQARP